MKCKKCGATLTGGGLQLKCASCKLKVSDCRCDDGYFIPDRKVSCKECGRNNIETVDTTSSGWRKKEV